MSSDAVAFACASGSDLQAFEKALDSDLLQVYTTTPARTRVSERLTHRALASDHGEHGSLTHLVSTDYKIVYIFAPKLLTCS
jgi:hypothetical protein